MLFDSLLRATTLSTSSLFILVSLPFYWLISCRTIRQWTKSLLHPHTRRRVSSHSGILRFVKIESFLLEDSLFCLCWNHSISLWRLLRSSKYSMSVQCHSVEHSKISESISSSLHISKEFNNVFDTIKSLLLILQNEELFTCLIPFYNEDSTPSLASSIRSLTEWIYTILHLNQLTTVFQPSVMVLIDSRIQPVHSTLSCSSLMLSRSPFSLLMWSFKRRLALSINDTFSILFKPS